ncbi:MAG TPA: glutamine amidotransferase [Thermomicrobiaceae bacterium]|nr:glutamine amidotransferase [Thermomicrobiaceae bacterium]
MKLTICWLYGAGMNIYGDRGNVLALAQRCRWRGIDAEVVSLGVGEPLEPGRFDIFFWGGGQDREQIPASADIQGAKGETLRTEVDDGAPLLSICGGYQLLGAYYRPFEGPELPGIGLFDVRSEAGHERFIGNEVVESDEFGEVVGFENHSGLTYLGPTARPLGRVRVGHGNNGRDGMEGCRYRNAIGCYLHGALLPKNPAVSDFLIRAALERRYGISELPPLDDALEAAAHASAVRRAVATR